MGTPNSLELLKGSRRRAWCQPNRQGRFGFGSYFGSEPEPFDASNFAQKLLLELREAFKQRDGEIGHLKIVITSAGKSLWANLTHLAAEPSISGEVLNALSKAALIINARVRLEPEDLEALVRDVLGSVSGGMGIRSEIDDLQCFSPAYPEPPHVIRESLE